MPAISLTELQEQIAQREQELQALREELQNRQSHLAELTRRKEDLQSQLRQIDEEIAALAATAAREAPAPAGPTVPPTATSASQPRLGDLIEIMLREAAKPMTASQLSAEAQRRGFQPRGKNLVKSIEARLQDLKNKGIVRRASGQPGYVLTASTNGAKKQSSKTRQPSPTSIPKTSAKPKPAAKKSSAKEASAGAATTVKPGKNGEQTSLRDVVTGILKNSRKPLSTRELADQIRATGYHSDSKDFVKIVGNMLSKMDNVEGVPDKGYRLKRA